ncbi:MAG TPA: TetR/AcrR family transcriptional regulator [Tepidisphaeraceae bacterium]|jgi:AcrR family transcriptional regulator
MRLKAPQRRQQLMDVASKLFAKHGYEATTTAAIAEAAGVTEPILYRHFESKQEMFIAIVKAMSAQTMQHWQELIRGIDDPAQQIRRISAELPEHMNQLADAYRVLHGALATSRDKKVLSVVKEHYTDIEQFFSKIVRDGQKIGNFRRDVQPKTAAWQLIMTGIGYGMIALHLMPLDRPLIHESIDSILRGLRS